MALFATPLGGNVNAQLVGSTLLLTGDALDNQIAVFSAAGGTIAVLGNNTTINGGVTPFVTTRPVTTIVANLNAGNDYIAFSNDATGLGSQLSSLGITLTPPFNAGALQSAIDKVNGGVTTFSVPGSVTVTTGAGDDVVSIIGTVGGSVAANLGSAIPDSKNGNRFAIGNPSAPSVSSRVGGSMSVVGGDQIDAILVTGTDVGGVVSAALGNGENLALTRGNGSTFGGFAYTGGKGDDYVFLEDAPTIRNGVSVYTGAQGEDRVEVRATAIGGDMVVNTGAGAGNDYVEVASGIRGGLTVITGAGQDRVSVASDIGGGVSVIAGDGGDSVRVEPRTIIGGGLTVNSGAGDDSIGCFTTTVALNTVIDAGMGNDAVSCEGLTTRSNLFVYLGPGNDQLELYNVRAFAAFLYGGTGTNSLTTNAATRSGIRTLKCFQFQTVNNV
ncbi:MAG: hypothetical protein ACKOSQ_05205 [Planctomycetaceae bacterium]